MKCRYRKDFISLSSRAPFFLLLPFPSHFPYSTLNPYPISFFPSLDQSTTPTMTRPNKPPNPPSSTILELGSKSNHGDPFPLDTTTTHPHPSIATPIPKDATGRPTGTPHDYTDMHRLGRTQELRRTFRSLSVLGLAVTTMSSWVALLVTSTFSLINGGLAGSVWVFLVTWVCTGTLVGSLAEMASMAPTSGGQYVFNLFFPFPFFFFFFFFRLFLPFFSPFGRRRG